MIAASAARADLAVAHEALSALDVPPSPSVATRVASLAQRTLDAEALAAAQALEIANLRKELDALRELRPDPEARLFAELIREARP